MTSVGLMLADHKTEALLISSRKVAEKIIIRVQDYEITSQPFIWYLLVIIDARLNLKEQIQQISQKASVVAITITRLMPNVGGPRQKKRKLLASVTTSLLTYEIPVLASALLIWEYRRKIVAVHRVSILREACAFRTVSEDAINIIAEVLPIELLADERRTVYQLRKSAVNIHETEVKAKEASL